MCTASLGAIHKGRPHLRGEGGSSKADTCGRGGGGGGGGGGGEGGQWQKADVRKFKFLPKF